MRQLFHIAAWSPSDVVESVLAEVSGIKGRMELSQGHLSLALAFTLGLVLGLPAIDGLRELSRQVASSSIVWLHCHLQELPHTVAGKTEKLFVEVSLFQANLHLPRFVWPLIGRLEALRRTISPPRSM